MNPTHASVRQTSLGYGLGLRPEHYEAVLAERPALDWFEATSENYMVPGGRPPHYLERVREHYPVVLHGVSLSIGGCDPLDERYLDELARLAARIEPAWLSDHLCWTGFGGHNLHDLLPMPYTEEAVAHVVARVHRVQERLGRRIALENVSSYAEFRESEMTEWEFLAEVAVRADCLILLDVNNVWVSSVNHGFDPRRYVDALPAGRVQQIHLAGPSEAGALLIDTHDNPVQDPVWELYAHTLHRLGPTATMIERDDDIPPLGVLLAELDRARRIAAPILAEPLACPA